MQQSVIITSLYVLQSCSFLNYSKSVEVFVIVIWQYNNVLCMLLYCV